MRKFINKILDVPKLILRIWLILWACLIILLIMKFCFGIWYPVVSNNEIFNNICNFIDNHDWLYKIISFILYFLSFNILVLTSIGQKKYYNIKYLLSINIIIISSGILKIFNSLIGNIIEIVSFCLILPILNVKKNTFNSTWRNICAPIFIYLMVNLWQLSIYLVRGLNIEELKNYNMIIPLILMLDYYIFLIILWIGVSWMSWFSVGWLFGKDITELKALREKELKKENPNKKKIETLELKIAELEKEGK